MILLSILFPIVRWATIEMHSNCPPKFPIATGEWATAKHIPCIHIDSTTGSRHVFTSKARETRDFDLTVEYSFTEKSFTWT